MADFFLESDRLGLLPLDLSQLDFLFSMDSNPVVREYFPGLRSREEVEAYIRNKMEYMKKRPGLGNWMARDKASGAWVGMFVLADLEDSGLVEVGYRLDPSFWGQGLATEMTQVLLDYARNQLGLGKVVGITHPENVASQRVLEKAGLVRKGMAHHYGMEVAYFEMVWPV